MITGFDDIQKLGKDNVDNALKSANAVGKGFQAIAAEAADYSKQTFDAGSAALEKLLGTHSFEKALEVQSDYIRAAYEGYLGRATKVGEIVADMAKDAYKPYESLLGKNGK